MAKLPRSKKMFVARLQIIFTIFSLAVSLTAFSYLTYSWFTTNKQVQIENTNTAINEPFNYTTDVKIDDVSLGTPELTFKNFFPGNVHSQKLTLTITSNHLTPFKVRWFFDAPKSNDEVPYIDSVNNAYYYLGSQLQARIINTPGGNAVGVGKYLVTTSSDGLTKGQVNSVNAPITTFSLLDLVTDLIVAPGASASVNIYFTFVDNGTDQSVYATHRTAMISKRTLALFVSES